MDDLLRNKLSDVSEILYTNVNIVYEKHLYFSAEALGLRTCNFVEDIDNLFSITGIAKGNISFDKGIITIQAEPEEPVKVSIIMFKTKANGPFEYGGFFALKIETEYSRILFNKFEIIKDKYVTIFEDIVLNILKYKDDQDICSRNCLYKVSKDLSGECFKLYQPAYIKSEKK